MMRAAFCRTAALCVFAPALAACQSPAARPDTPPAGATSPPSVSASAAVRSATKPAWVFHDGVFFWGGDYSYSAKPLYTDKEGKPLSGRYDIKVTLLGPWGGFQPFARNWDFDLAGYGYLTFALKPTVPKQSLKVYFEKVGDVPTGVMIDPLKYGPAPVVGEWTTYVIPLADLAITGTHVYKFAIQDQTGLERNVFYLDDIGFLPAKP